MYGIMEFFEYVSRVNSKRKGNRQKPFKPVIGCELCVAKYGTKEQKDGRRDLNGYHLTILAKNFTGYRNLVKLVSNAWTDGFYASPRTDRMELEKYREGLIVCSGGTGSEVFAHATKNDMNALEETIKWYRRIFADDYYIELQRYAHHRLTADVPDNQMNEQEKVNMVLFQKAKELGIKVVGTNDVHFTTKSYAEAYECQNRIALGNSMPPIWQEANNQKWLKSRSDMNELFADIPEAIDSTMEIIEKVEFYDIHHAPIYPQLSMKGNSGDVRGKSENESLSELVYERAKQIYGCPLPVDVDDRLRFELDVIKENYASGYFLFVQELVNVATEQLGVLVGPGRGSAAGSLVSYCLGITKIDPLKHDLLFERFLCPGHPSIPDIYLDFDAEGRTRIIDWLEQKYGKESCAHVVTFERMSSRKAFMSVAQVEGLSPSLTNSIDEVLQNAIPPLAYIIETSPALKKMMRSDATIRKVFRIAQMLEGTVYDTGIHACGYVISNNPVDDYAPTSMMAASDWNRGISRCVQYDCWHMDSTGLILMDFLRLDRLTQKKVICERIKASQGTDLNLDLIPVDDVKTFELFRKGETQGVFLFDSEAMRRYLRKLCPTQFEDLVLLHTVYRPGPLSNIPRIIANKTGKKKIRYTIPCMEKYLHDTYGILVYQEQLM